MVLVFSDSLGVLSSRLQGSGCIFLKASLSCPLFQSRPRHRTGNALGLLRLGVCFVVRQILLEASAMHDSWLAKVSALLAISIALPA